MVLLRLRGPEESQGRWAIEKQWRSLTSLKAVSEDGNWIGRL